MITAQDIADYDLIQKTLSQRIIQKLPENKITKIIAGVDSAYWEYQNQEFGVCCIITLDANTHDILEKTYAWGKVTVPYLPGYLSFRETNLICKAIQKLNNKPDLYIFDGNGYLHPRHMGLATHMSFLVNTPTIGVSKSYHKIENTDFVIPENKPFAYTDIIIHDEVYGRALRTIKDVKPIFVSVGNYIDLDTATNIICELCNNESHIPIPTRLADIYTHEMRKAIRTEIQEESL